MVIVLEREEGGPVMIYGVNEITVLTNKSLTGESIKDEDWHQGFRFIEGDENEHNNERI